MPEYINDEGRPDWLPSYMEKTMGSIADRFHNVSQQTFRAAIGSPEAMKELRGAAMAFVAEIDALLPADQKIEESTVSMHDGMPPVAESEWIPPASFPMRPVHLKKG
jgi:hypothetical protein